MDTEDYLSQQSPKPKEEEDNAVPGNDKIKDPEKVDQKESKESKNSITPTVENPEAEMASMLMERENEEVAGEEELMTNEYCGQEQTNEIQATTELDSVLTNTVDDEISRQIENAEQDQKQRALEFVWQRRKVFDRHIVLMMLEQIKEAEFAEISNVSRSQKTKKRPMPLNTIDLQKLASKKLHFSASKTMEAAEKLYNKGLISYPRTETNFFASTIDLGAIIKGLTVKSKWSAYARKLHLSFQ